jgi:ABC-type transport system substrate-binding protein
MEMEKKNVAIIILAIALVASGVGNILFALQGAQLVPPPGDIFLRATSEGAHTLDPVNSWDSASNDVIEQVTEGLFGYNYSDVNMPRINVLATGFVWDNPTQVRIQLRQGVTFHDGGAFNATAVKWNLDRINYFTNSTGLLPSDESLAEPSSLYWLPNGTGLMTSIAVLSEFEVRINIHSPYAPFIDLLCYAASAMISPYTHDGETYIELYDDLVGTGPYKYDYFVSEVEVRFSRWDNYWRDPVYFDEMVYVLIRDATTRNNAMLGHEVDYISGIIPALIDTYEADAGITVKHFSLDTGKPGLAYYYLGMNNVKINLTMRKAISFAINYTYIVEVVGNNLVFRANGPISPGYGAAYNASVQAATFNLAQARQILIDEGAVDPAAAGWTDAQWRALALDAFNYTYNTGNQVRADIGVVLTEWLDLIGIDVIDNGVTWSAYLTDLFVTHNNLGIFWIGWGPDYLDPFNMLDPLFNPISFADSGQVDDPQLIAWMAEALVTTDDTARNNIYKKIQWYLAERLYPHAFGYHPLVTSVHGADIHGVAYNAQGNFYAYPIYRA